MGKIGKIVSIIILLVVLAIAGLIAFVHYYLTEDRVKAIVIPQAETALGREVAIGDIKIGLLSGITIRDFLIKESDGKNDFVTTKAFVLRYQLLPLLQKKLIISEIRFDEPAVLITRDKAGTFNFSTLALLSDKPEKKDAGKPKPSAAALPLALTINQIRLNKIQLKVRDALGVIPAIDGSGNANFNVALGSSMQDLQYSGSFDLDAAIAYGETQTRFKGNGNINRRDMDIILDTDMDGEQIHAEADVKNYLQSPTAAINISSKSLNIDKLLRITAALPKTQTDVTKKPQPAKTEAGEIIADSLPPGLIAKGTVKVDKAMYQGLTANDFTLVFDLKDGVLSVRDLSARAYGGKLASNLTVDLKQPGTAYDGKLGLQSLQADDFSSALVQRVSGMLTGTLQSDVTFSGAGTTWEQLRKVLTADGSFTLTDGGIKGTPVTMSIANLLALPELNNISYKDISGTFTIVEGGQVKIKTKLQGADLDAEAEGIIGLDGSLDLPLTFHLSPVLAEKLKSRASFTQYLSDEQGATTLHLKLAGSLKSPRPTLDMKNVQDQMQKTLQKEIFKKLDNSGQDSGQKSSPESIIKGLFGK